MTIKEIYNAFDKIGCLTFATVNENGEPETRIAHLRAYDEAGIYFQTMNTKAFYAQMKKTGKLSVCGMYAENVIEHDDKGFPIFKPGYTMRMTGDVKEVNIDDVKEKNNPAFELCIKDIEKYNSMVTFCITSARGEIYDFDFERLSRENKLQRIYFAYGGAEMDYKGLMIDSDSCISCGVCKNKCSFLAISEEEAGYSIDKNRCDECGDCLINCPVGAIINRNAV